MIRSAKPQSVSLMLMIVTGVALLFMGSKGGGLGRRQEAATADTTEAVMEQEVVFAKEDDTNFFFATGIWEGKTNNELRYFEFYPEDQGETEVPEHADWAGLETRSNNSGTYEDGYHMTGRFVYKNSGLGLPFDCVSHGSNLTFKAGNSREQKLIGFYTWKSETSGSIYWQDGTTEELTYLPGVTMKQALASGTTDQK